VRMISILLILKISHIGASYFIENLLSIIIDYTDCILIISYFFTKSKTEKEKYLKICTIRDLSLASFG
jgi:hypothetical protein